jgi:futalosine hydrolase
LYDTDVHPLLRQITKDRRILLAVAAPIEARAILAALGSPAACPPPWEVASIAHAVDLIHLGVSKSNAAGALSRLLAQVPHQYGLVLNAGIAGSLPDGSAFALQPRDTIVATNCVFADEGIVTPAGYQTVASMGFPINPTGDDTFACDPRVVEAFRPVVTLAGEIATVSTCSGTDALARAVALRTRAAAESMEGAACALVCHRAGIAFAEVRAISNFTGDRAKQAWDIRGALDSLERLFARMLRTDESHQAR